MLAALFPYLIAFFAIFCYATLTPLVKFVGEDVPPFTIIALSSLIHVVIAGGIAFAFEKQAVIEIADKARWGWFVLFSLTNLVGYWVMLFALKKIPVTEYQIIALLTPIISGILAYFLMKEPFHPRYLVALAFVTVGIFIAVKPEFKGK